MPTFVLVVAGYWLTILPGARGYLRACKDLPRFCTNAHRSPVGREHEQPASLRQFWPVSPKTTVVRIRAVFAVPVHHHVARP